QADNPCGKLDRDDQQPAGERDAPPANRSRVCQEGTRVAWKDNPGCLTRRHGLRPCAPGSRAPARETYRGPRDAIGYGTAHAGRASSDHGADSAALVANALQAQRYLFQHGLSVAYAKPMECRRAAQVLFLGIFSASD